MPKTPKAKLEALALAVASGTSVRAWCKKSGVPRRTAYRWTATAEFKQLVAQLRNEAVGEASNMLVTIASRAVKTLESLLSEPNPATVRLGAARAILSSLIEVNTFSDLDIRLAELEKRADARDTGPPE